MQKDKHLSNVLCLRRLPENYLIALEVLLKIIYLLGVISSEAFPPRYHFLSFFSTSIAIPAISTLNFWTPLHAAVQLELLFTYNCCYKAVTCLHGRVHCAMRVTCLAITASNCMQTWFRPGDPVDPLEFGDLTAEGPLPSIEGWNKKKNSSGKTLTGQRPWSC